MAMREITNICRAASAWLACAARAPPYAQRGGAGRQLARTHHHSLYADQHMRTVADQFAETLAIAGIKRIYGIVGDSLNGLTDAIRRQGKIEWLHVRHEEVAAFAAGAEAHLTGELAVCAGS